LKKNLVVELTNIDQNMDDFTEENIDDWSRESWDGGLPVNVSVNTIYRTSRDGVTYSDYELLTVNTVTGRYFNFGVEMLKGSIYEDAKITTLQTYVYLKQRLEQGTETTSSAGETTKNFNFAFYQTPTVTAVISNASSGDYVEVSNVTTSGFDVSVRDSGGSRVVRNVIYLATGLGQRFA